MLGAILSLQAYGQTIELSPAQMESFVKALPLSEDMLGATIGGSGGRQCNTYGYCAQLCTNIIYGRKSYLVHGYYNGVQYGHYYCGPAPSGNCTDNMQMICGVIVYYSDYNCTGGIIGTDYKKDLGCIPGP
ncbi:MAG: hypothetical protein ACPL7E_00125 [bacterium]